MSCGIYNKWLQYTFNEQANSLSSYFPAFLQLLGKVPPNPLLDDYGSRLHAKVLLPLPVTPPSALDYGCHVVLLYLVCIFSFE